MSDASYLLATLLAVKEGTAASPWRWMVKLQSLSHFCWTACVTNTSLAVWSPRAVRMKGLPCPTCSWPPDMHCFYLDISFNCWQIVLDVGGLWSLTNGIAALHVHVQIFLNNTKMRQKHLNQTKHHILLHDHNIILLPYFVPLVFHTEGIDVKFCWLVVLWGCCAVPSDLVRALYCCQLEGKPIQSVLSYLPNWSELKFSSYLDREVWRGTLRAATNAILSKVHRVVKNHETHKMLVNTEREILEKCFYRRGWENDDDLDSWSTVKFLTLVPSKEAPIDCFMHLSQQPYTQSLSLMKQINQMFLTL